MKLPKELTTVTPVSKAVALIIFITLPIIAFLFGMRYQTMSAEQDSFILPTPRIVKQLPSPTSYIFPPNNITPTKTQGVASCGGIAGKLCSTGYYCKYESPLPDAGGTCVKTTETKKPTGTTTTYTCPKEKNVNCMPGTDPVKAECSSAFLQWAQANCPNFKGVAY